ENIIWAVEHGHQAAISIHNHCQGIALAERPAWGMNLVSAKAGMHAWSYSNDYSSAPRTKMQHAELAERFAKLSVEVELGFRSGEHHLGRGARASGGDLDSQPLPGHRARRAPRMGHESRERQSRHARLVVQQRLQLGAAHQDATRRAGGAIREAERRGGAGLQIGRTSSGPWSTGIRRRSRFTTTARASRSPSAPHGA